MLRVPGHTEAKSMVQSSFATARSLSLSLLTHCLFVPYADSGVVVDTVVFCHCLCVREIGSSNPGNLSCVCPYTPCWLFMIHHWLRLRKGLGADILLRGLICLRRLLIGYVLSKGKAIQFEFKGVKEKDSHSKARLLYGHFQRRTRQP